MENFISTNGIDVYYREYGQGQPLILLHGATDTQKLWEPHLEVFSKQFRVITPDSRGHGRTINPSRELSYQLMADDLAGFIQELGLEKPFLFGYSDGGQAVLDLGIRYPDLPGRLVVGGAWYRFSEEYQTAISQAGFISPGVVDWEVYQNNAPADWQDRLRLAHQDPDPEYPRKLLDGLSKMWWTPLNYQEDDFKKISVPTLILMGEKDEMIPVAEAREMAELIPGAKLEIIPNATHNDVLSLGSRFPDLLIDFLETY
jgi:pimeloyl-ACP methyl ester carboxylesterase